MFTIIKMLKARRFARKIRKEAIKDWIKDGNFETWFWDRADFYDLDYEDIQYIDYLVKYWVNG